MALFFGPSDEYKVVVIVRTDLDMGKGKIAAQVGHASVECALAAEKRDRKAFDAWMASGQKKVVLKVSSRDEMIRYMAEARSKGIFACKITDAGRTQIEPGSDTCVGLGPAPTSELDRITGSLKML
ncbi:MAG: peptidyl-tRNA hydrolase Pth2 [Thermoplasmata archaeon]|nr:peptidyl-tRNA hydrolase Pth2 [Thermoplasmata archaeon]